METNTYLLAIFGAAAIPAWYLYQIGSRKKEMIRYKVKRSVVGLAVYLISATLLARRGLPPIEAVGVGVLVGLGSAWLLVKAPRRNRRIPKTVRRKVIARDLESKGLKWDPAQHHIDHLVPFSKGGDNSPRNLRVVEKQRNLSKGSKMPGFRDFLR